MVVVLSANTGTTFAHAVLGLVGIVPGPVGIIADIVDAAIYAFVDHDVPMMLLSLTSAVSMGASIAKAAKTGTAMSKSARNLSTFCSMISNGTSFLVNANVAIDTGITMINKYVVQGQS